MAGPYMGSGQPVGRDRWGPPGRPPGQETPPEKTEYFAFLAFDLPEPRTYNPRPRCFAAVAEKRCLPLKSDVKIVAQRRCLTL